MESDTGSTSFIQYQECSLCHVHHKQGYKHVFSKKHQENVGKVLTKFKKKIMQAKSAIISPQLSDVIQPKQVDIHAQNRAASELLFCSRLGIPASTESSLAESSSDDASCRGVRVWCYFCAEEVTRDKVLDAVSVAFGGFIEHLSCDNHKVACEAFWKLHAVDQNHSHKQSKYSLTEEQLNRFTNTAKEAVNAYNERKQRDLKMEAEKIQKQEVHRTRIVACHQQMLQHSANQSTASSSSPWQQMSQSQGRDERQQIENVRTMAAKSVGLTCINLKREFNASVGNIHMGAPPPWATNDRRQNKPAATETSTSSIGPTLEDYEKHLAAEKKDRLPADRVGAQEKSLDRDGGGQDWLPAFGRVWTNKPRTQTRKQFMMNAKSDHQSFSSTVTSLGISQTTQHPSIPVPEWTGPNTTVGYKRKRPNLHNHPEHPSGQQWNSPQWNSPYPEAATNGHGHSQGNGYQKRTKMDQPDQQFHRIDISNKFM